MRKKGKKIQPIPRRYQSEGIFKRDNKHTEIDQIEVVAQRNTRKKGEGRMMSIVGLLQLIVEETNASIHPSNRELRHYFQSTDR